MNLFNPFQKTPLIAICMLSWINLFSQAQTAEVAHTGTILLTETDQEGIILSRKDFDMSINKLLHDDQLTFFARQMSDSSYVRINTISSSLIHRQHNSTFFLFRGNTQPVQCVLKKFPKDMPDDTKTLKQLYYDFDQEKMIAAVALEDKTTHDGLVYQMKESGVIQTKKAGNLLVVQYLVEKSTTDFCFYKLESFTQPVSGLKSLSLFSPQVWQSISMTSTQPVLKLSTRTDQPYPLGAANLQIDLNEEFVGLRHGNHVFGNINTGKVYEINSSKLDRNWTLINDGKVVFEKREKEETNAGSNYYSTVVIYDIVNDKQVKQITLPGTKVYELRFSGGKYLVYWDKSPDVTHYEPKLFDIETESTVDVTFPAVLEKDSDPKKKKKKVTMAQVCLANGIQYDIQDVVFSRDLTKFAILSNLNLSSATSEVKYEVNGKQVLYEEFIDMYHIK